MSLTTVENVTYFLNKESLDAKEQLQIEMLIKFIDGVIENYCGWNLLNTTYTNKKFDGNGLTELDLKVFPITELTSVTVTDSSGTVTDVTADVKQKEDEGILYLPTTSATLTTFTSGTRNVSVTFKAGFTDAGSPTTNVPSALSMAATELVVRYFNRISLENIGIKKERFEQDEAEYDKVDIPELVARVLDRYRRFIIV